MNAYNMLYLIIAIRLFFLSFLSLKNKNKKNQKKLKKGVDNVKDIWYIINALEKKARCKREMFFEN